MESLVERVAEQRAKDQLQAAPGRAKPAGGGASASRRTHIYFPDDKLEQIRRECERLDRSVSWLVTTAWELAAPMIRRMEKTPEPPPEV